MKVVCISDTHGYHESVVVPDGDLLIHAGDFTGEDIGKADMMRFLTWFDKQPHPDKILVAGNHDGALELWKDEARELIAQFSSIFYLQDSFIDINGVLFWGSPWTPEFCNWHFNLPRGEPLQNVWSKIRIDTNVLITHGPPHVPNSKIDVSGIDNTKVGCVDLYNRLLVVKPEYHICGHIHHGYGMTDVYHNGGNKTHVVNCSICNEGYKPINKPFSFEI